MIGELSNFLDLAGSQTAAYGPTAAYIQEQVLQSQSELLASVVFGEGQRQALEELARVVAERTAAGWDGDRAEPVSREAAHYASQLIRSLPYHLPLPSLCPEPDGCIELEWYRDPGRLVVVSVDHEGQLHWITQFGGAKSRGTTPFYGSISGSLLEAIERVTRP